MHTNPLFLVIISAEEVTHSNTQILDEDENCEETKRYFFGMITLAILVAILLIMLGYLLHQNKALRKSIADVTANNKEAKTSTKNEVIYDQPVNVQGPRNAEVHYDNLPNDNATYTALNRNRKNDDDHFYSHLNAVQQKETGI